jgi:hypothetical protein
MLKRKELLGQTARRYQYLDEWGRPCYAGSAAYCVRSLSEQEKTDFEASVFAADGKWSLSKVRKQRRKLLMMCLVDDKRDLLLRPGDEAALAEVDGAITSRLYDAAREHAGFEDGEIEALAKNSAPIADDGSPTVSV